MYTYTNEKVRLRAVRPADADDYVRWMNDVSVSRNIGRVGRFSREQEAAFIERIAEGSRTGDYTFAIEAIDSTAPLHIGNIGLYHTDTRNRQAELGIMIGEPAYMSKGYGSAAIRLIFEFGFGEMNLHRIYLRCFDFNARAIRAYEKCGFQHEGIARESAFLDGAYRNDIFMSILKPEWEAKLKVES